MKLKLTPELVPKTAFYSNLRKSLPSSEWDAIRVAAYMTANYRCEICDGVGKSHPVECHEIWKYENDSQILDAVQAICPSCHEVKHIGLAQIRGRGEEALKHMMKVNKISKTEALTVISECFEEWNKRSQQDWEYDTSKLEEIKRGLGI